MRTLPAWSLLLLGLVSYGCSSSQPAEESILVATEPAVLARRAPVLVVMRPGSDGDWIFLSDEVTGRERVVYASFTDILTLDSTLAAVRDLPVWWGAVREAKGAAWTRTPLSADGTIAMRRKKSSDTREPSRVSSPRPDTTGVEHFRVGITAIDPESSQGWHYVLGDNALEVWQQESSASGNESNRVWSDSLRAAAQDSLDALVRLCGLDTLQGSYGNRQAQRDPRLICSFSSTKRGYISTTVFVDSWIPALYGLTRFTNAHVPRQYALTIAVSE